MKRSYLFTSESVSEGHPDKVCDRISDMVVDTYLSSGDPQTRVACETLTTTNKVVLAGEVRGPSVSKDQIISQVRDCIKDIGYEQDGFHWQNCDIESILHEQSADIAMGVDSGSNKDEGAGDQGIMFGFACKDTESLMPAPIHYSHQILYKMAQARKDGSASGLEPDSKSQVTMLYENGKPSKVTSLVISSQHKEGLSPEDVKEIVKPYVYECIPNNLLEGLKDEEFYVNPTGNFVIGGPDGDSGLTGRKIIVDTYGGAAPHGGGAFSGKDPSKVDRSAAYAARYLQVLDHIPLGNNKARVIVRHYRKFLKNKLLNKLILFKENQRKIFYKIFDEDYMILKTQTYNHNMGYVSKDEIKLLGEDRIINYFWKWYKKSEDKDEPWRNINKTQNFNVYDKVIMKYPPEVKKLEIINNINIIRKTFIRFAAPLIFFMLII